VVSTNNPLSQLDHRVAVLQEKINEMSRARDLLAGEDHRQKSAEIERWAAELEELLFERRTLSRDAT
jgi:hypothetical protein